MESDGSHSKQNRGNEEAKDFWTYLEDNRREVATWPTWMRGETRSSSEGPEPKGEGKAGEDHSDSQSEDLV